MDKTFTPITILLIEDNPAQEGIKTKDLKSRGIDIGSLDDNIDVPGINFKKEGNKELHNLFTLKVLQHPEEIKEFMSNCLEKEDKEGSVALGDIAGIVPEIVEFDYKLWDNFQINSENKNIKYWSAYQKLREHYNPNFLFKGEQHLEKKENENYTEKDFIERINKRKNAIGNETWYKKDVQELENDELGLYAGVEITRIFRNHVCIGIPATSNFDVFERLHVFGKFYEWMNDYDLGTMFSREERGNKDWDSVIAAAVKQLRIRIETQIQSNKITLNLTQLLAWANEIPTKQEERIFTFQSAYGVRHLPLDGLFIDEPINSRDTKIKEWVNKLLKNFKTDAYKSATIASETLINAHKNTTLINNRMRISELIVKLVNNETFSDYEKKELSDLKEEFGITCSQIKKAMKNEAVDIATKKIEYREFKTNDNTTNRLIVLFTDLRLHFAWQQFCEMNKKSTDETGILALLGNEPTLDDLITALYPIPMNPLILPYHSHLLPDNSTFENKKKQPFDTWEQPIGAKMKKDAIFNRSDYPKNLNDGERVLCKSFCLDIGLKENYFPKWLITIKN